MIQLAFNYIRTSILVIWNYFKPSWEGEDGKLSYRRASQFVFICLIVFLIKSGSSQNQYGFYSLVALLVTFLLTAGMITAQQLLDCFKELNIFKSKANSE